MAFSACDDAYVKLLREADGRLMRSLCRTGLWRRKNACPACTYELKDEQELLFKILVTMDGSDSLKEVLRRSLGASYDDSDDEGPQRLWAHSSTTERYWRGVYLPNSKVNVHEKHGDGDLREMEDDGNPCASRWGNMHAEKTSRMWRMFDESGVFVCLCKHGFALVVLDMLCHLEIYVLALALSTRYASTFHRRQAIEQYIKHLDQFETSYSLSKFLVDNYRQALSLISGEADLRQRMAQKAQSIHGTKHAIKRRQVNENPKKAIDLVHQSERLLGVEVPWTRASKEYLEAAELVRRRRYQRCLGELERLVVQGIFELTKMNKSQTGYKLRKHIAQVLQARSQAIKSALERYNGAAKAFKPPLPLAGASR
ncbi:hypothetical protein FA13DRAFT_1807722 [Coprinellus micaceus]|uniref:CxC2-like cysteine cluster KDZ transposase-associated domain-containing protein n=1 Tax=Coprinellus micaceus TaxID=71717 RepID=A0A4Y7R5L4_COPMI|nr:hypothetical protein FA13DRAFT_1807722 [Coprinellus micaceus]